MPLYIFARFEPRPGKERQLQDELELVLEPTQAEPGCIRIHLYQSTRPPVVFFIHSEWVDEAAFEIHAELPHTMRMISQVADLIAHPLEAVRTMQIG